jgi:hypothetical protein
MAKPAPDYDPSEGESSFKGVILPSILIVAALLARIVLAMKTGSTGQHIGLTFCQLIISLFILLVGCFTMSAWMDANFGPIDRAILKLCAISLTAGAIGTALAATGPRSNIAPNMTFVAWYAVVFCYLVLFLIFFAKLLGAQETVLTVCVIVMMQLAVSFAMAKGLGIGDSMALFFTRAQ